MADEDAAGGSRPLAILVHDDAADRVHYALVLASSGAAVNRSVTFFCAGRAVRLLAGTSDDPGWRRLAATGDGQTARQFDHAVRRRGGADFETLLDACREMGVTFICCELAARLAGLEKDDLRADLDIEIAGAATFLARAGTEGQIVSF